MNTTFLTAETTGTPRVGSSKGRVGGGGTETCTKGAAENWEKIGRAGKGLYSGTYALGTVTARGVCGDEG